MTAILVTKSRIYLLSRSLIPKNIPYKIPLLKYAFYSAKLLRDYFFFLRKQKKRWVSFSLLKIK